MNKMFLVKSTLFVAINFAVSAFTPVMAELNLGSSVNVEGSKKLLRAKLADLNFFSADFTQKVLSEAGDLLEQSSGQLAISKPNLANWHTLEPDEVAIVSDGNDVWFYNPWIEQVSVYSLSAAIAKTPILLLTSKDESLWQQYTVNQKMKSQEGVSQIKHSKSSNTFVISAKDPNSQIKSLTLVFSSNHLNEQNSTLNQFSFLDATGQVSHITLSKFDAKSVPESSLFTFKVPDGVQIDDQRTN